MAKIKQSKFELMRIISMFLIVFCHVIYHGQTLQNSNGTILLILEFLICITLVHVNSFILLTGYFQYNKKFTLKKFLQTFTVMYFYKITIYIVCILLNIHQFNAIDAFNIFNPFNIPYWYISCYLILYLLSPFLNILIKNMNQSKHRKFILILVLSFSILPLLSNQTVGTNDGFTVIQFIMLYFIGAYFSKYPINENIHFKNYSKNKIQTILLFGTIIFTFLNYVSYNFGITLYNTNSSLLQFFGNILTTNYIKYNFIFLLLQSICYFLWFSTLKIQNNIINYLSSLTLGIYLIHEHPYIRSKLYNWFNIANFGTITSKNFIIKIFVTAIIIFIGCGIIEAIRQIIFKFIKNRKIYQKLSNKFYNYIDNY